MPVLLTKIHHIDPIDIGFIISAMGLGMMIAGPIAGQFIKIYGAKPIIILGSLITGLGTYMQSYITAEFIFLDLLPSQLLKGIGTQLLFMGSQYICFSSLKESKIPNASAMYNLTMRLTAAVSISVSSNYLIKFKKQFFLKISDYNSTETLTLSALENDKTNSQFLDSLFQLYERESFIMAFNKISYISFWTSAIPLFLLLALYIKNK
tara:strand:- start:25 stop:648 length:624 start_codon:yes stop_codon:yes gene_type:complete